MPSMLRSLSEQADLSCRLPLPRGAGSRASSARYTRCKEKSCPARATMMVSPAPRSVRDRADAIDGSGLLFLGFGLQAGNRERAISLSSRRVSQLRTPGAPDPRGPWAPGAVGSGPFPCAAPDGRDAGWKPALPACVPTGEGSHRLRTLGASAARNRAQKSPSPGPV